MCVDSHINERQRAGNAKRLTQCLVHGVHNVKDYNLQRRERERE